MAVSVAAPTPVDAQSTISSWPTRSASLIRASARCAADRAGEGEDGGGDDDGGRTDDEFGGAGVDGVGELLDAGRDAGRDADVEPAGRAPEDVQAVSAVSA